jgi:hypothetical protein
MLGIVVDYSKKKKRRSLLAEDGSIRTFKVDDLLLKKEINKGDLLSFIPRVDYNVKTNDINRLTARDIKFVSKISINSKKVFKEIANWKLEAKLEDNERYFYHLPDLDYLLDGSRCYVIGRKGTGKTAIAQFFLTKRDPKIFSEKLSFKNFPFNDFYAHDNSRYTPPNQYITFWKYLIYSTIAQLMIKNENIDPKIRVKLEKIYPDINVLNLERKVSNWVSTKIDFKILGSGL